ncbi:glycosyltransferase family 2 protein [Rhodovulum sp. DZ06]|uniref:glycosyltransferase family 2 protein n=1 Tax=Rhodovulum sp. DZ06 TaxID=3425126 RepID=UPI003D329C4D
MTAPGVPLPRDAVIGLVAIGRNEGARLRACLTRARALADAGAIGPMVYVDSGSTDDSVATAEELGVQVVHLDTSDGFTAGKARNAGAAALAALPSPPALIQFVDGDAVLDEGWLPKARAALEEDPTLAATAGRRREMHPGASIFNRMCDMEWNTPVGLADAIGGDALYRADAFHAVSGFDPGFICGEEPELNRRLRAAGWRIRRLDAEMTLHDAAMTAWSQHFKRTERAGWAFAEGADRFGAAPDRYNAREAKRIWFWGLAVPAGILGCALLGLVWPPFWIAALLGLLAYPAMALKVARWRRGAHGDPWPHALLYGALVMLGKPWEALGALRYHRGKARGERARIIEYKGAQR